MNASYLFARLLKKLRGTALKESRVHPTSKLESGSQMYDSSMDRHSFCGYDCSLLHCDVGAFTSIANRVTIGGVAHPMAFVSTSPAFLSHKDSIKAKFAHHDFLPQERTTIGSDVWIGEGAYIKAGVTLGHGAVVGMGSVVTKDVRPYEVVAGNPAKHIRTRFDEPVVAALLRMAWWDLPDDELRRLAVHFDDPVVMLTREGLL
jgi:chloramphenicol O-acetyltransferase type B